MKLLLDECIPRRLKREFSPHETLTVDDVGLKGLSNGELLAAASKQFDVFITVDRNIRFQQNLSAVSCAIIILKARHNSYSELLLLVPQALEALERVGEGDLLVVPEDSETT